MFLNSDTVTGNSNRELLILTDGDYDDELKIFHFISNSHSCF